MVEEKRFEVWDRVTGRLHGSYDTEEEARKNIPSAYYMDFVVIDTDDDLAA